MRLSKFPISVRACTATKLSRERNQNSMKRVMGDPGDIRPRFHDAATRHLFLKRNSLCIYVHRYTRGTKEWGFGPGMAVISGSALPLLERSGGRISQNLGKGKMIPREVCCRRGINSYGWISYIIIHRLCVRIRSEFISRLTRAHGTTDMRILNNERVVCGDFHVEKTIKIFCGVISHLWKSSVIILN